MSTNRSLLDVLGRDTLVRLMRERGLAPTRENEERRKSLAHSYRGDVEALVLDLTRQELVDIFRSGTFEVRGVESYLANPGKYRLDELQDFALRAFAGRRVKVAGEFTAVEGDEDEDEDDADDEASDDAEFDDEEAGDVAGTLGVDRATWSRPRRIARILAELGHDPVQRLRTSRFQNLIEELLAGGVEACLADDPTETPCRVVDDSPGIEAKLRLRLADESDEDEDEDVEDDDEDDDVEAVVGVLREAGEPMRARDIGAALGISRTRVNGVLYGDEARFTKNESDLTWSLRGRDAPKASALDGGPRIVVQAGERPIPVQPARPAAYPLAILRLQFLTAVPSVERRALPAWPDGYLAAATRGLTLHPQELTWLRAYAAGLCIGNHSPHDPISQLTHVLSATEWETLLADFQALNPFQPELVAQMVELLEPVTAPRSSTTAWRRASSTPPDLQEPPHTREPSIQPMAAASVRSSPPVEPEQGPSNQRDLGALASMFDEV